MNDQSLNIAFDQSSDPQSNAEDADKRFQDGPWAQKFMLGSDKKLAITAAERARMRMTEWLGEAIRGKVALEREDRAFDVLPPDGQTAVAPQSDLAVDDVGRIIAIAEHIARLENRPVPRRIIVAAKRRLVRLLT